MKYIKKIFIIFVSVLLILMAVPSLAVDSESIQPRTLTSTSGNNEKSSINSDLCFFEKDKEYVLNQNLLGNGYIRCDNFSTSTETDISGDLYISANSIILKSAVDYFDENDKEGNSLINKINSSTSVFGNVYAITTEFVLEPGVTIDGNLYVVAEKVTLAESAKIYGNTYIWAQDVSMASQVGKSMYVTTEKFNMSYYGFVYRDLFLNAKTATLNGGIYRNTNIYSEKINVKDELLIYGNLEYSSKEEITIKENMVNGKISYSEISNKINIKQFILYGLITLIAFTIYVFAIFIVVKFWLKKCLEKEFKITAKNIFLSFGIGILSFIVTAFATRLLLLTVVGYMLAVVLLATFAFILAIAVPMYIINIAKITKKNLFIMVPIISVIVILISFIPYIGGIFATLFTLISVGNVILRGE